MPDKLPEPRTVTHSDINLSDHVDHAAAPMWYTCAYGTPPETWTGSLFLCPVCGSSDVHIRFENGKEDSVLVCPKGGEKSFIAPMDGGAHASDGPDDDNKLWVCIPMRCGSGHTWLLDIDETIGEGPAKMGVLLDEPCYEAMYPEAKERWS